MRRAPTIRDGEPCKVAAQGICWMIAQPASYPGRRESMAHLALRENIMPTVAGAARAAPPTELFDGLLDERDTIFEEPHP